MSDLSRKFPVGRPRVKITPTEVHELRSQGVSWRKIAKCLKIGTATAMRLFRQPVKIVPLPEA
jgi:hypothetical protein